MGPNTEQMGGVGDGVISGAGGNPGEMIVSSGETVGSSSGGGLHLSRGMVLGIILAVLVLVGGGVAWVVVSNLQGSQEKVSTIESYNLALNNLIDFLNGTDGFALDSAVEKRDTDYIDTAEDYWNAFLEGYSRYNNDDEVLKGQIDNYTQALNYMSDYIYAGIYTEDELLEQYFELGPDELRLRLEQRYKPLVSSSYQTGAAYAKSELARQKSEINVLNYYAENGCIHNNSVDETCVNSIEEPSSDVIGETYTMRSVDTIIRDIKEMANDIRDSINKGVVE